MQCALKTSLAVTLASSRSTSARKLRKEDQKEVLTKQARFRPHPKHKASHPKESQAKDVAEVPMQGLGVSTVGPVILGIGLWGTLYKIYDKESRPNSVDNHL